MSYRRRDTRPRLALWMLVALGDIVLLLVSAGLSALVALLGVVAVTVAGVAAWRLSRRRDDPRRGRRARAVAAAAPSRQPTDRAADRPPTRRRQPDQLSTGRS